MHDDLKEMQDRLSELVDKIDYSLDTEEMAGNIYLKMSNYARTKHVAGTKFRRNRA